mmetsp:Transcript_45352/g.150335  ORF Transcript_45352/g.150335 Transcript_45352/m.150335 type:complete len:235 (+) Transcript_45352:331-1035(+)
MVQSERQMSGRRWLCHRSRHCLPLRMVRAVAMRAQFLTPWLATSRRSASSSDGAHGRRFAPKSHSSPPAGAVPPGALAASLDFLAVATTRSSAAAAEDDDDDDDARLAPALLGRLDRWRWLPPAAAAAAEEGVRLDPVAADAALRCPTAALRGERRPSAATAAGLPKDPSTTPFAARSSASGCSTATEGGTLILSRPDIACKVAAARARAARPPSCLCLALLANPARGKGLLGS